MPPPAPSPTTVPSQAQTSLLDGVQTHGKRPSITLIPLQPGLGPSSSPAPSAGPNTASPRTSPTHYNAWQNYHAVQQQHNGVNPPARVLNGGAVAVPHNQATLPTFAGTPPAFGVHMPSGMVASASNVAGFAANSNSGPATVIDLTQEGEEADGPRKRRRIDELAATSTLQDVLMSTLTPVESTSTPIATPAVTVNNSPSLSMQPMGQELASLEAQMGPPSWPDLPIASPQRRPAYRMLLLTVLHERRLARIFHRLRDAVGSLLASESVLKRTFVR